MTAFSTISFPSSFQLRAGGALTTDRRRRRTTAVIFLRGRGGGIRKAGGRMLRLTSVAQNNRVKVRRSPGDSWVVNSNSKSWLDDFAGWNWNWDGDENASDSQPLKGLDVLMQPLISNPEMSEASTDQENVIEVGNNERKISTEHNTTDPKKDASSSIESNEASESNYRGNDTNYKPPNVEAPDLASSEKFLKDVTGNDLPFASEDFSERQNFQDGNSLVGSSCEEKDVHFPSEKPGRLSETEADQESFSVDASVENSSSVEKFDLGNAQEISAEALESYFGLLNATKPESSAGTSVSDVAYTLADENIGSFYSSNIETNSLFGPSNPGNVFTSACIPAPTFVSAALPSEKVRVPAGFDEVQVLTLPELKVIEAAQAGDTLCEYARWLRSGLSALSRSSVSKVYPTMYNKNGTELAFDDITAEVTNFSFIQGSAEAGLISSTPSRHDIQAYSDDTGSVYFSPKRDASLSIESNEASESNYSGHETYYKPIGVEAPDLASSDKFPNGLTSNDMPFASEDISEKQNFWDVNSLVGSSSKDVYVPSEKPERLSETEAGQESFSVNGCVENLNHDSQEKTRQGISAEDLESFFGSPNTTKPESFGNTTVSDVVYNSADEIAGSLYPNIIETISSFGPSNLGNVFTFAGMPAPTVVSATLLAVPGKVLVPGFVDQVQAQASAAFQVLKAFGVHSLAKFRLRPALVADLTAGAHEIVARALGYTRLFQPAQAATGEASDLVGEDPARVEAESMAEKFKEGVHVTYEKELQLEREKVGTIEKLVEGARHELDMLRTQREEENLALMKERAAIGSQLEVLTKLRCNLEEELHLLLSNKMEKLRKDVEFERQEITRLQYEDERKALSMIRSSAEEKTKRARDQAKALDLGVARENFCSPCIKDMPQTKNINIHPHININLGVQDTWSSDIVLDDNPRGACSSLL